MNDEPRTCDLCHVYLRREHTIVVTIDGRVAHRLTVCLDHLDRFADLINNAISLQQSVAAPVLFDLAANEARKDWGHSVKVRP